MERKTSFITSMVLSLSLFSFFLYQNKVPAESPAQLEVAANQTKSFVLASV